ncbi:MAG TPA: putative colanic acid biosynthesis acetyltransferase [Planctomycetota bacterium]|nr:putative colanic acid biosynthesis acetyltransferase [Planctomycetota bacterium]
MAKLQDLSAFRLPANFRGRPEWYVQLWWLVQSTLFALSPQFMYGWRRFLLRCFGARVGKGVIIRPSVKITYPWKVSIGDYSWVGDDVVLYSLGEIEIGSNSVISQKSYLCTGSHDFNAPHFDIFSRKITIADEVWVATDVFIAPGISIGRGAVVGARSSVFKDIPELMLAVGNPAAPVRPRCVSQEARACAY